MSSTLIEDISSMTLKPRKGRILCTVGKMRSLKKENKEDANELTYYKIEEAFDKYDTR